MSKTSSLWQTKEASCSGGIHHSFFCQGLSSFFLMSVGRSHAIPSKQYPTLPFISEYPQGPSLISLKNLTTIQCYQMGFFLSSDFFTVGFCYLFARQGGLKNFF